MKRERYIFLYIIAILLVLLIVTSLGYYNYKNASFDGLSKKTKYTIGRRIKYADLNWYVLNDNGNYVTLILSENATLDSFGDDTNFNKSKIKDYLNKTWISEDNQEYLREEIDHGALVLDKDSNTYIRLAKKEELEKSEIKNESDTPFWTMSVKDNQVYYALANGKLTYTSYSPEDSTSVSCYSGNNLTSLKELEKHNQILVLKDTETLASPSSTEVTISVKSEKITSECKTSYKIEKANFYESGKKTSYVSSWNIQNEQTAIGVRPVITVKKK